ncbi:MAG TPA: M48 family metalloprotease [Kofleriaceae bacterium]|nr:M48 family metalloprotease [Kofleriaceae bacterium]
MKPSLFDWLTLAFAVSLAALCIVLAGCSANAHYLGAPLPAACSKGDVERCAGWMAERDLVAGQLDVYDDPDLRAYVQRIADRLAQGAGLERGPRIVIANHDGTYAAYGERIVVGRMAIEKLGSEAELAAIVAHELAHVEGHHASMTLFGPDADAVWLAARRDAEAIADERAVALLERAGYTPSAMRRALAASLDADDDEHPPKTDRLTAVSTLAAGRTDGFDGRDELLAHVDGMVVGRDPQLGMRIDNAWVIALLGVAIQLPERDVVRVDGDELVLRRGRSALTAYPIGAAWARELAASLDERASVDTRLGPITVGVTPSPAETATPIGKLQSAVRELLPQPAPGTWVVILVRPGGGLVLELAAKSDPFLRDRWLSGLRAASPSELLATEPTRIAIHRAPRAGRVAELVEECPDPYRALALEDPDRMLAEGQPFKCTDR